jgi:hypothetical protein
LKSDLIQTSPILVNDTPLKRYFFLFLFLCSIGRNVFSQPVDLPLRRPDVISFGVGFGFDYGGILGASLLAYPCQNIGLFVAGGYAVAGFGYNAGIKLRVPSTKLSQAINPYVVAMYGFNAAVYIANNAQYNRLFYGSTFGAGVDVNSKKPKSKGYVSVALLVPIRDPDAQNYVKMLKNEYGADYSGKLLPIGVSVGYRFILY